MPNQPEDRLEPLWTPRAILGAMLCGQGLAIVMVFSPGLGGNPLLHFAVASMAIQWVLLLTLSGLYLARHWLARRRPAVTMTAFILLLVAASLLAGLGVALVPGALALPPGPDYWARLALVSLTVGLFCVAALQNITSAREAAVEARSARLHALQARIRPHFLFNTLNTATALVHDRPESAESLLLDLSDLFRAALSGPQLIPLEEEIALARRYLDIEQLRFGDRLRIRWELPAAIPGALVPALSLQPLVENAVRHGIEPSRNGGELRITVTEEDDSVRIRIENPVTGRSPPRAGHSIGLASVRARISALGEDRGRVEVESGDSSFRVTIRVPKGAGPATPPPPDNTACTPR